MLSGTWTLPLDLGPTLQLCIFMFTQRIFWHKECKSISTIHQMSQKLIFSPHLILGIIFLLWPLSAVVNFVFCGYVFLIFKLKMLWKQVYWWMNFIPFMWLWDTALLLFLQFSSLTNEGGRLRRDVMLVRGKDFEIVPEPIWRALACWYGGAPSLPRTVSTSWLGLAFTWCERRQLCRCLSLKKKNRISNSDIWS